MHFAMPPDNLFFFCCITVAVCAAFGLFLLHNYFDQRHRPAAVLALEDSEEDRRTTVASGLPPFMYNRLVRHSGKDEGGTECAVCLSMIQVGAMVKLLPACGHVYHVDCIDLWLSSCSTCPLCRSRVHPSGGGQGAARQQIAGLDSV